MMSGTSNVASPHTANLPDFWLEKDSMNLQSLQSRLEAFPDWDDGIGSRNYSTRTTEEDNNDCSQLYLFELSTDFDFDGDASTFSLYSDGVYNEGDDSMSDISGPYEGWEESDGTGPTMNLRTDLAISCEAVVVGTAQILLGLVANHHRRQLPLEAEMGKHDESITPAATTTIHVSGLD